MKITKQEIAELIDQMLEAQKLIKRQSELVQIQEKVINLFLEGKMIEGATLFKSYLEEDKKEMN